MSNFTDFYGGGGIKSIQRGDIGLGNGTTFTATVSAVNPAKAVLMYLGTTDGSNNGTGVFRLQLTNGTTITAIRYSASNSISTCSWQLVEYY